MAAEPNVAALLAALAGQTRQDNRGGPQNQAPALNPQQLAALAQSLGGIGGLAGMPQQQQPPPLGGMQPYGMPQPSSSGSLDISKIVPSSTGSLSISDSMARVKSRPNDMGMNNSRYDDPRSRRRTRSRSRSPPPNRRDRYDGGFRDDRRGGRNYDRERSYSPPRRGGYSPPPRERGGRGASHTHSHRDRERDPETTMYQMRVESGLVGLIIGRGGETLRRVEQDTGCKVQFLTGNEYRDLPDRPCNITGTPRQIDMAKKAIMQIIDENAKSAPPPKRNAGGGPGGYGNDRGGGTPSQHVARDGDDNMQIMVPDRTVGLIIGRHGETIRDLQERSGCHINIVGESKSVNGLRPVNLIGPPESARRAKELIMEIVDSDIRSQASGGAPISNVPKLPGGGPSGYFGGAGPSGEKSQQTMKVPIDAVGMIIGRGGETIKEMQASTGCRINVSSSFSASDTEREITLQGTPESIDQARAMISDKVHSSRDRKPPSVNGGGRGRDDYDNQYSSPPPQHRQYQQPGQPQQQQTTTTAAAGATAAAAGSADASADPYAPWGGYEAYAQMYWTMIQQQAAASGGAPGAPGTS